MELVQPSLVGSLALRQQLRVSCSCCRALLALLAQLNELVVAPAAQSLFLLESGLCTSEKGHTERQLTGAEGLTAGSASVAAAAGRRALLALLAQL